MMYVVRNYFNQMKNSLLFLSQPKVIDLTFGKTRKMTGFLATLTDEQKKKALAYRGEENHGDKSYGHQIINE